MNRVSIHRCDEIYRFTMNGCVLSERQYVTEYCITLGVLLYLKTLWIEIVIGYFVSLELRETDLFQIYMCDEVRGTAFQSICNYLMVREFMC